MLQEFINLKAWKGEWEEVVLKSFERKGEGGGRTSKGLSEVEEIGRRVGERREE